MNETALLEFEEAPMVEPGTRQLKEYQLTFEDRIFLRSQAALC